MPKCREGRSSASHFKESGVAPTRFLREVRVAGEDESKPGDEIKVSVFEPEDYVDVVGTSKGKGFQGVMKRHGFGGGRATHGSMFHRAPGYDCGHQVMTGSRRGSDLIKLPLPQAVTASTNQRGFLGCT